MKQAIRGFARAVTGWMRISRGGMVRPLPQGHMTAPLAKKAWRRNSAGMALALGACMAGAPLQAQQVSGSVSASSASAFAALTTDASEVRNDQVDARLLAYAPEGVAADKPLWVGLQLTHQPHWHTYWRNPGDSGQATSLRWTLPAGMTAGDVRWPVPTRLPIGQLANYGYDGTVLLPVAVHIGPAWKAGAPATLRLQAQWLVCRKECIPQQGQFSLTLPTGQAQTASRPAFETALARVPVDALPGAKPPSAHARVDATAHALRYEVQGLPAAWQGKALNLYPETPTITPPADAGKQGWSGATWWMTLPLDEAQRTDSPGALPIVLALRGETDADGIARNAAQVPPLRLVAPVQGTWPAPAQTRAEVSPALQAALQSAQQAASATQGPAERALGPGWWLALGAALLGGLILNLMPCVFPVLAIKILALSRHAHDARQQRLSGLAYSAGVILSFVLLAGGLLALRSTGQQLGWGFQLQNPWTVAALATLFTLLGLNLAGLFEVGHVLPARWMQATARHPVTDALLSGVLAVLVASPCTAPFMGASLGLAMTLPAWQALTIFAAMGLGLALPVGVGSFFPGLTRWLPRPGAWMQTFRTLMAFPMLGTVIWLVWVLGQQSGMDGAAALLALLLAGSGLVWTLTLEGRRRWALRGLFAAVLIWLMTGYAPLIGRSLPAGDTAQATETAAGWQPWSEARVQQALAAGQPVFVDYTAAWCVTCQVNKHTVLETEDFRRAVQARHVLLLRADWTRADPAITASLARLGRSGVPVYVLHDPRHPDRPHVLVEVLRLKNVQEALSAL